MTNKELVAESNKIEGILRSPTDEEISAFKNFLKLDEITIADLQTFVNVYQPGAKLRNKPGMNVSVGNHSPPLGGPRIEERLQILLDDCNCMADDYLPDIAYTTHMAYERLHPFMDGNGRSGRMLWYWMMRHTYSGRRLGFLHVFYYQTLSC